ncbi:MAG: hypothetical protein JST84_05225 [Acidobacteria bacterium]|nr:hypothetical protein [Acidobacteriota bacterium]
MPFQPNTPFSINNTELHTWFERDRKHIELRNANTQKTILEFWDDEVDEAVEDGFLTLPSFIRLLDKSDLHQQMYDLAVERGLIRSKAKKGIRPLLKSGSRVQSKASPNPAAA